MIYSFTLFMSKIKINSKISINEENFQEIKEL